MCYICIFFTQHRGSCALRMICFLLITLHINECKTDPTGLQTRLTMDHKCHAFDLPIEFFFTIYMIVIFLQNGKHQQISGRLQDVRIRKQTQKTELEVLDKQCDLEIMEIKQLQQELQVGLLQLNGPETHAVISSSS